MLIFRSTKALSCIYRLRIVSRQQEKSCLELTLSILKFVMIDETIKTVKALFRHFGFLSDFRRILFIYIVYHICYIYSMLMFNSSDWTRIRLVLYDLFINQHNSTTSEYGHNMSIPHNKGDTPKKQQHHKINIGVKPHITESETRSDKQNHFRIFVLVLILQNDHIHTLDWWIILQQGC